MATWPAKTNYATGDVLTAAQMNDIGGELNDVYDFAGQAAGKNKIINGDFGINQRNFTSNTADGSFNFDRWLQNNAGGTVTTTPQTFTAGAAPVAGYEGKNFQRTVIASQSAAGDAALQVQKIEDVRTLANQTATISFWAKASSGTPKIGVELYQNFGTSGSAGVSAPAGTVTLSTSWVRYNISVSVPSISGKTISANDSRLELNLWLSAGSNFASRASSIGIQNNTFDIWGVQVEAGDTASQFQTATPNQQSELAACQRYYIRWNDSNAYSSVGFAMARASTNANALLPLPTKMRIAPTSVEYANMELVNGSTAFAISAGGVAIYTSLNSALTAVLDITSTGMTTGAMYYIRQANNTAGYIGISAEL